MVQLLRVYRSLAINLSSPLFTPFSSHKGAVSLRLGSKIAQFSEKPLHKPSLRLNITTRHPAHHDLLAL
jgi:hypothetical protein